MGRGEGCTGVWWGKLRERDHWGDPGGVGRLLLRWIFRKWGMDWIELAQDRQVAGTCECGNEPSDSMKSGEFLD
jgi:hypothetical protein